MFEEIRLEGNFTLSSGKRSNYYYAFETLTPTEVKSYSYKLSSLLTEKFPKIDYIATPAYGGIPIAFCVALDFCRPLVVVEKRYNAIRGPKTKGPYIIVDDVISTYDEIRRVEKTIGYPPLAVAAFIFRGSSEAKEWPTIYLEKKEEEL